MWVQLQIHSHQVRVQANLRCLSDLISHEQSRYSNKIWPWLKKRSNMQKKLLHKQLTYKIRHQLILLVPLQLVIHKMMVDKTWHLILNKTTVLSWVLQTDKILGLLLVKVKAKVIVVAVHMDMSNLLLDHNVWKISKLHQNNLMMKTLTTKAHLEKNTKMNSIKEFAPRSLITTYTLAVTLLQRIERLYKRLVSLMW